MGHKKIINVYTIIARKRRRQLVCIQVEGLDETLILTPENIFQNTQIEVNELELLVGSRIRTEFYQVGEVLLNGSTCNKDNHFIRNFYIELESPLEKLREAKKDKLMNLRKITNIFTFKKLHKHSVGIELEDGEMAFLFLDRMVNYTGLHPGELHILIGSYANPTYFKKGDKMWNGIVCEKERALKSLNLRFIGKVEEMHQDFEESSLDDYYMNLKEENDYSPSYSNFGGPHGFDDLTVEVAFEGDPSNIWNIL